VLGICNCGCNTILPIRNSQKCKLVRFVHGHNITVPTTTKRICHNCGSDKTYIAIDKRGIYHTHWHPRNDKWYCNNCYHKVFENPFLIQMRFKGKELRLKENPRTGTCSHCNKHDGDTFMTTTGKISIVKTTMHHIEYHEENVLKDTIELCRSCHAYETWRLGQFDNRWVTRHANRDR
jgi:hypothetical protein